MKSRTGFASIARVPQTAVGLAVLLLAAAVAARPAHAAEYYAATTGSPSGTGSIGNPWDLQTALIAGAPTGTVQPGDTVWVRGGVYLVPFTVHLKGTPAQPIVVRNYPGERVLLDRQYSQCDPSTCPALEWQAAHPWFPTCFLPNNGTNYQCNGFIGTGPCDPTVDPACVAPFNYRHDALTVPRWSHDVWIWGFEMADLSDTPREYIPPECTPSNPAPNCCWIDGVFNPACDAGNPLIPKMKGSPVWIDGDRIKLINSLAHDSATPVSWFTRSTDSEVYGTLSFNGGYVSALRGMHHGCYAQNVDTIDTPSEKVFRESIFFNNYGLGMQIYGACGPADSFLLEGVVSFSTTLPAKQFYATQDPAIVPVYKSKESQDSILLSSSRSSHRSRIRSTYVYNPIDPVGMPTFDHGSIPLAVGNASDVDIEDSVFVGDGGGVSLRQVAQARFVGNTVVGQTYYDFKQGSVSFIDPHYPEHIPLHVFGGNAYYRTDAAPRIGIATGLGPEFSVPLATWQSTYGKDLDSTGTMGVPLANQIFVRPNAYEPGRGHVIVYNWAHLSTVPVDLSPLGLAHGQGFKVHNIQSFKTDPMAADWMGNVAASGTFDSGDPWVDIDMTDTEMVIPIGSTVPLPTTLPEFGVFVVLPQ